jgi:outer membrane receptor protein involved in Fe transport
MLAPMAFGAATTGTIQGIVTSSTGVPLAGVTVTLVSSGQTATTDSKGSFVFTGVEPSVQTVVAHLNGQYRDTSADITVSQDITSQVTLKLVATSRTVTTGTSRVTISRVNAEDPSTSYGISAQTEQQTKSQPNNLYQFPGLVFGQPGITPDPSGYDHIRGSDVNQVGFDVDGVQITEPMTNTFATNLVTVGLKSANLITGGADASYGNASGGFINEVTNNGRDLRGGIVEGTFGPDHGWNYRGTNTQYGNVIGGTARNPKFDYYVSTIQFANNFPGNTQIQKLGASFDGVAKFNYYADPNNTFTTFLSQGFEQYDDYQPYNPANTFKYQDNPGDSQNTGTFQQDHDDQGYNFNYLGYKHNFSDKSFATYRLYQVKSFFDDHAENTSGVFETRHSTQTGNQLDYTNQISPLNQLKAGLSYIPSSTYFREVASPLGAPLQPSSAYAKGAYDFISQAKPDQSVLYLSDQIKALQSKLVLTLGARYANMDYRLNELPYQVMNNLGQMVDAKSFNKHYVDPRVGATYSLSRDFLFRSSYAVESQFSDSRLVERLFPEDNGVNINPTATSGATQLANLRSRYAQYNTLGPNHANNFDLGFDKGFTASGLGALSGGYTAGLTGFSRYQYDLIQYTRLSYVPLGGIRGYDNSGHGHASGVEFKLAKAARSLYDVNGFLSYTNLISKATNSDFDTGYIPYYYNAFAGDGSLSNSDFNGNDHREFLTSYSQRHTIGADVTKRFNKILESSLILDAGSGFPFSNGLANTGEASDAQHTVFNGGGNSGFAEVPVTLTDQRTLQPQSPTIGQTGWHYKISLNTNFYLTPTTNLFFDVDNVFDKQTVLAYSTVDQAGAVYYSGPSAAYPQGRVYYGPSTIITPIFATFGFRVKF